MTGFHALIPVKRLCAAKQRMASLLDPAARTRLAAAMFASVLRAASASARISSVTVITADSAIGAMARDGNARIHHDGEQGLNQALAKAARAEMEAGRRRLVVLLADLPWLSAAAIDDFLARAPADGIALASDQHRRGTSALAWSCAGRPPCLEFGPDSLAAHIAMAARLGIPVHVAPAGVAFHDVDDPRDMAALARTKPDLFTLVGEAA